MKNVKVSDMAHDKLKVFAAKEKEDMGIIASVAIVTYIKENSKKKTKLSDIEKVMK